MCLLDRGVAGAKPELVIRNEEGEVHIRTEALQKGRSNTFDGIGRRLIER